MPKEWREKGRKNSYSITDQYTKIASSDQKVEGIHKLQNLCSKFNEFIRVRISARMASGREHQLLLRLVDLLHEMTRVVGRGNLRVKRLENARSVCRLFGIVRGVEAGGGDLKEAHGKDRERESGRVGETEKEVSVREGIRKLQKQTKKKFKCDQNKTPKENTKHHNLHFSQKVSDQKQKALTFRW